MLSIPIPKRALGTVSLQSCLEAFTEKEVLDTKNTWKCEGCEKMVQATKRMGVHKCSAILVIDLKRFEGSGWASKKISTAVSYPDLLDNSVLTGRANGAKYKLIGAVFHGGTCYGGHYTAAVLDQKLGKWYSYNDSQVTEIGFSEALSANAYILFYQKVEVKKNQIIR
jgi:ubiquitin C-terminal hydrolase